MKRYNYREGLRKVIQRKESVDAADVLKVLLVLLLSDCGLLDGRKSHVGFFDFLVVHLDIVDNW